MRVREFLYFINAGCTPAEVAKEMELTESESRDVAIYLGSFLQQLQLECCIQDKIRLFNT